MPLTTALHTIGYYCGRHGSGWFDEPQNSFSNMAFVIGAAVAFNLWRKSCAGENSRFQLVLIALLASIGVGSFIFHSYPTPLTLYVDLVPIQIYILAVLAYVLNRVLGCSWRQTAIILVSFFVVRQAWLFAGPQRLLGGGVTHLPTLLALMVFVIVLARRGHDLWKYLVAAAVFYMAALAIRSWDVPLCDRFPVGFHWAWHMTMAIAATLVLLGLIRSRPRAQENARPGITG